MVGSRDLLILQKERHGNVRAHSYTDSEGLITGGVAIDHDMLLLIFFISGMYFSKLLLHKSEKARFSSTALYFNPLCQSLR